MNATVSLRIFPLQCMLSLADLLMEPDLLDFCSLALSASQTCLLLLRSLWPVFFLFFI